MENCVYLCKIYSLHKNTAETYCFGGIETSYGIAPHHCCFADSCVPNFAKGSKIPSFCTIVASTEISEKLYHSSMTQHFPTY